MDLVSIRSDLTLAWQIALAGAALAVAALAPPAHGALLAVPLSGEPMGRIVDVALAHGATIAGAGPLPGSVVLRGDRARLAAPLRAHGVLLLAGSKPLCGG